MNYVQIVQRNFFVKFPEYDVADLQPDNGKNKLCKCSFSSRTYTKVIFFKVLTEQVLFSKVGKLLEQKNMEGFC